MSLPQNNPFNKPNPFKVGYFESIQPSYGLSSNTKDFSHFVYHDSHKNQYPQVSSNWSFNQNNLTKKVDFGRKYQVKGSQANQFQLRMRASTVFSLPNNQSKAVEYNEGKLQNPFHRKNLLVNKEAVASQIQADLSIYRIKTSSVYQPSAGRASFAPSKVEESPIIWKPQNQIYVEPYNPYIYPQNPKQNDSDSNPQKQRPAPKTLEYKRKTFFLNTPLNNRQSITVNK